MQHERELAGKDAIIADLKNKLAYYEGLQKSFASRWQQLIDRERKVEERDRGLNQKEQSLYQNFEEAVARRVAADIKGKQKGIDANWKYLFRKEHRLKDTEQKMFHRAKQLSEDLGVPLERILKPEERKLISELTKELKNDPRK